MAHERLQRVIARLQNLPAVSLPTDYPRPTGTHTHKLIESVHHAQLSEQTSLSLLKLALFSQSEGADADDDDDDDDDDDGQGSNRPSAFHLLLAAFTVLLHRYTGDTDIVVGSSSASARDPLILRVGVEPADPYWAVVQRVQDAERAAEADALPYDVIIQALNKDKQGTAAEQPLFRVRFFDETDTSSQPTTHTFIRSTSLTSDLTIFITLPSSPSPPSSRTSLAPHISLRILYNSLLFTPARISTFTDQLSVLLRKVAVNPLAAVGAVPLLTPAQKAVLPDPKADLDWCGWKGAITDVFSANARKHPERACVVQSLPARNAGGEQERVVFSYGAILGAANVLAHYLVRKGVEREDVVMVYAHRSVDLVVAVMAVLKAGATFSVIDPAYPPSRQIIYLRVAQPRGLVVLKGAGKIDASVRTFLSEELAIKVEVPALEVFPDGRILGGSAPSGSSLGQGQGQSQNQGGEHQAQGGQDQEDILTPLLPLAHTDPPIPLGPDSIGTLSFTSGSTGIPKGVRGRHFSLTHFFPWMGERFGLGAGSRFTMLSGIAHDPIQRDMFTPLFFGAQLHVPTAEDIGTPGRLAAWMSASRITTTHLTPAMGQLLSALPSPSPATSIPSLTNAFFVGDVLTKRDCLRLQSLAPNCSIINMYGTTETQRAVSYFEVPPVGRDPTFLTTQKEVIPAGVGMRDVQLLVVNRVERNVECAVGEVGEIYVRSSGLAEGYLDPAATQEKFVTNWFGLSLPREDTLAASGLPAAKYWKGPRDRMYRSGDLGRYTPAGTVECTGRADDQVKIRGFRIELGEIDTHLSQHPLVRENVTLVRRDKDEEKILVSYFVPLQGRELEGYQSDFGEEEGEGVVRGMRRYRRLIKDIREHLKKKLPSYSIPTLFVPLSRMPLNPNGKIDKPALPFPDTALTSLATSLPPSSANTTTSPSSTTPAHPQLTPTERTMASIWASILPNFSSASPESIPLDESFFDLGGHSILATRLIFEIRRVFVVDAPLGLVFDQGTASVRGLARAVERLRNSDLGLGYNNEKEKEKATVDGDGDAKKAATTTAQPQVDYGQDYEALLEKLAPTYAPLPSSFPTQPLTIFLTGATGFLGAFVLYHLLSLSPPSRVKKVICLVRAKDSGEGMKRLREGSSDRGVWDERWVEGGRVEVVTGDLGQERFGMGEEWERVGREADVVLHNGALVHWVFPYEKLRSPNVLGTLTAIALASFPHKPKSLVFVSSTSAIDTEYYVQLSESLARSDSQLRGVPEDDDLEGAREGLKTGYGQSKWVSEKLLFEAGRRGLRGHVVRPGYVVGDSKTAVTNTDDFIWRLVKGCIQLGLVPDINNTINMVPVDHVARATALAALQPLPTNSALSVLHITARPLPTFNGMLAALPTYGFATTPCEYLVWRRKLEQHVMEVQDNALFPLLHFVLDDLPTSTKSPELDDKNTVALLEQDREGGGVSATVDEGLMGLYLAWLVGAGFLPPPTVAEPPKALPVLANKGAIKAAGRTGL